MVDSPHLKAAYRVHRRRRPGWLSTLSGCSLVPRAPTPRSPSTLPTAPAATVAPTAATAAPSTPVLAPTESSAPSAPIVVPAGNARTTSRRTVTRPRSRSSALVQAVCWSRRRSCRTVAAPGVTARAPVPHSAGSRGPCLAVVALVLLAPPASCWPRVPTPRSCRQARSRSSTSRRVFQARRRTIDYTPISRHQPRSRVPGPAAGSTVPSYVPDARRRRLYLRRPPRGQRACRVPPGPADRRLVPARCRRHPGSRRRQCRDRRPHQLRRARAARFSAPPNARHRRHGRPRRAETAPLRYRIVRRCTATRRRPACPPPPSAVPARLSSCSSPAAARSTRAPATTSTTSSPTPSRSEPWR